MCPVELRPETLMHDVPGQNQTPAFLRRQKKEPQRSNEAAESVQWVLLVARKFTGSRVAPDGLLRQEADPKYVLSPLPPLGTGHMRFKIPGPKGLSTLRPVLTGEPAGPGSKGASENTAVCKQSWDCDVAEGVSTHLC